MPCLAKYSIDDGPFCMNTPMLLIGIPLLAPSSIAGVSAQPTVVWPAATCSTVREEPLPGRTVSLIPSSS
jgi:hypothetical protein